MRAGRKLAKRLAATADVFARPVDGVTILIYHRVGGRTSVPVDQPLGLFDEQMAWLAAQSRAETLDRAVAQLRGAASPAPGRSVVVTFDDGTADFVSDALPILVEHQVPATLYVATEFIERQIAFPDAGTPLTWTALAEAVSTGLVTVGSHTHSHALLDRLPEGQVVDELDRSIDLIGERLGVQAQHFAYPKALPGSPAADRAVRARFESAAIARTRPNQYGRTDVFNLTRSPIQVSDGMRWFERKANGGMWAEDSLRRLVNRRRYAGATT